MEWGRGVCSVGRGPTADDQRMHPDREVWGNASNNTNYPIPEPTGGVPQCGGELRKGRSHFGKVGRQEGQVVP